MPLTQTDFHHAQPVYEEFRGWREDISKAREIGDLPKNARAYVEALEEMSGAPFSVIGVGPARDQTIQLPLAGLRCRRTRTFWSSVVARASTRCASRCRGDPAVAGGRLRPR